MNKFLLLILVLLSASTLILGQHRTTPKSKILISTRKPAVYVSFVKPVDTKPEDESDERTYLIFRLTNNTRWNIRLDMSGFSEDTFRNAGFDPVKLYYAIEDPKSGDVISGSTSCHVCSINMLPPGRSLNFAVGVSEVSEKNRIRVAYTFDWEKEDSYDGSNSTHSVEYYFSRLPESILSAAGTRTQ